FRIILDFKGQSGYAKGDSKFTKMRGGEHMNFIGSALPDFTVNAFQNGEVKALTRDDLLGHWSVLFFYPADFSFVCPTELGDLAAHYSEFKQSNAEIYSVSEDTEFVHQAWHEQSPEVGQV